MANEPVLAKAWIGLVPTLKGAQGAIEKELGDVDVDKPGKKAGSRFGAAMGVGLVAASALIAKGLSVAISEASDLNESVNAVSVSYGKNADAVLELGKNAAQSVGLSNSEFNALAVQFSAAAGTIAGKGGDVVGTLEDVTGRASDFASVMNLEVADAAALFQSGLAGETEPLRKYGIDLSAASVEAYALSEGIWDGTGAMTEAQKVQARYGSLMAQTSKTAGDFANTSDQAANGQRIFKAELANLSATIGTAFLPAIGSVIGVLTPFVAWLGDHQGVLIALGAVIGVALVAAFAAWAKSIILTNIALLANPVTWIILGIVALVAAVVALVVKWDWVKEKATELWAKLKERFAGIWTATKDAFSKIWDFIKTVFSWTPLGMIVTNWGAIMDFFKGIPGKIKSAFSALIDTITRPFKVAFNYIATAWNNTLGNLSFTVPDIPGIPGRGQTFAFPRLPMLAEGGIVTAPTLALIGEGRGPEAVVPLDRADEFGLGGSGGVSLADLQALAAQIAAESRRLARGEVERAGRAIGAGVRLA